MTEEVFMWLDDDRTPPSLSDSGVSWIWTKNYEDAIEQLKTGNVIFASLDHDLADEHYLVYQRDVASGRPLDYDACKEKTGMSVLDWMEEHDVWPRDGVRVHTMNGARKPIMLSVIRKAYGRDFQYQIRGTHPI